MNGQAVMHPGNGILLSTKKKISYQAINRWWKLKYILLSESQSEKATYCMTSI